METRGRVKFFSGPLWKVDVQIYVPGEITKKKQKTNKKNYNVWVFISPHWMPQRRDRDQSQVETAWVSTCPSQCQGAAEGAQPNSDTLKLNRSKLLGLQGKTPRNSWEPRLWDLTEGSWWLNTRTGRQPWGKNSTVTSMVTRTTVPRVPTNLWWQSSRAGHEWFTGAQEVGGIRQYEELEVRQWLTQRDSRFSHELSGKDLLLPLL